MGKQVTVAKTIDVPGLRHNGFYTVGKTFIISDAEYAALPASVSASLSNVSTVAEPAVVTDPVYPALIENINTVAASGATQTLPDVTVDTIHRITLSANCALTFPTAAAGKSFTLVLIQDATGTRTVTWPGTVKWAAGTAPTLSTATTKVDVLTFLCVDGTNWLGFVAGLDMR